ncbi:MAG: ParB N-terminal domain-containing protein [Planctomycetota bacterium]|nr:ParB N-terminal domain-containing protein [Planctomycetota bacterium]
MANRVRLACETSIISVPLTSILPVRKLSAGIDKTEKYRRIAASIREVGIIEPLVVYPQANGSTQYILLDGHVRLAILKEMGAEKVNCLVAIDDDAFTYNHKVNQLSAIQEHFMIMEAIRQGVSEERIAKTLAVDLAAIRRKRDLLDGICPEAVQLLKEKRAAAGAFREIRKVKPMRQIEMAELMVAANNFSASYARCLLAATPQEQLLEPDKPKDVGGLSPEDMSRMEREMENLGQDLRAVEESHGRNVLNLVLVVGYLKKLLDNARVVRYLSQHCAEILSEFQAIVEVKSTGSGE